MHAKISWRRDIGDALYYHELKLRKGQAEMLAAGNFLKEAGDLTFADKVYQFERMVLPNERAEKLVFHVFMMFGKDEKLSNEQIAAVSQDYLRTVGVNDHPWLIYRHNDTPHPHAHLVSTAIGPDGKAIELKKAAYYESREITHALEKKYGLSQVGWEELYDQKSRQRLSRIKEGEGSLYPSMKLILDKVLPEYRYTSLDELNAVLRSYNVQACRGREGSEGYQNRGLYYRVLNDDGQSTGHYFRAGAFNNHPGIGYLETRFAEGQKEKLEHRRRLTGIIDYTLLGEGLSQQAFDLALAGERISVVRGDQGMARVQGGRLDGGGGPGIWYVDHVTKEIYEGKRLGAEYTAEAIGQRCVPEERYQERLAQEQAIRESHRQTHSLSL